MSSMLIEMLLAGAIAATARPAIPCALRSSPPIARFNGGWQLDRAASRGLPEFYGNVRSQRVAVTQSDSALDVFVTIDAGAATPDTIRFVYRLDGQPTRTATPVRTPNGMTSVPTTLTARPTTTGGVHIVITRTVTFGGPPTDAVSTEDWSMSADRRSMTVHRVDELPGGRRIESDMVFRRE